MSAIGAVVMLIRNLWGAVGSHPIHAKFGRGAGSKRPRTRVSSSESKTASACSPFVKGTFAGRAPTHCCGDYLAASLSIPVAQILSARRLLAHHNQMPLRVRHINVSAKIPQSLCRYDCLAGGRRQTCRSSASLLVRSGGWTTFLLKPPW